MSEGRSPQLRGVFVCFEMYGTGTLLLHEGNQLLLIAQEVDKKQLTVQLRRLAQEQLDGLGSFKCLDYGLVSS